MCLILFAYRSHPEYSLIVAANRDEFYDRPTRSAHFWEDHPDLLAGRDMKYGGTWMGITRAGKFAAVTNYRDRIEFREHPLSRGLMVKEFLVGRRSPGEFLRDLERREGEYNGFNLLLGDPASLYYYSNRLHEAKALQPGIHGLSNHLLDTPWPKVVRSRKSFRDVLKGPGGPLPDHFFQVLADHTPAGDDELPDTGFGEEWEKILSPPFIISPTYGTRTSTVLTVKADGQVSFTERTFNSPEDPGNTLRFKFRISPPRTP